MRKSREHKQTFSMMLALLYSLAVIFCTATHTHAHEGIGSDSKLTFSHDKNAGAMLHSFSDCHACHFHSQKFSTTDLSFEFKALELVEAFEPIFSKTLEAKDRFIPHSFLRGPPSVLITC